jgi:hypothetical protein
LGAQTEDALIDELGKKAGETKQQAKIMSDPTEIEIDGTWMVLSLGSEEFELVKQASPEYLERLIAAVPEDTSELVEDYEAPVWAVAAYEACWAAAYLERKDYAKEIYERCKLNGRRWTFSDLSFDEPLPCPVCFSLGHVFRQFTCGHLAYGFNFDEWKDSFPYHTLQYLDDAREEFELDEETWTQIRSVPDVSRILENLEAQRLWFHGFPCAQELRSLAARCDFDRFGDIEHLGFHPEPDHFLEEVGKLEAKIMGKLAEYGIEL